MISVKMGDDIKPDVIKKTQESLGKYIKKPPLTEKLLKKPPFRFLHDIITNRNHNLNLVDKRVTVKELLMNVGTGETNMCCNVVTCPLHLTSPEAGDRAGLAIWRQACGYQRRKVIRETGFLEGIFTSEELNHENVKDRESKITFLQKAIDAVKSITGIQLTARPSKIVAGHEPAKTNEFLQAIGKALEKKLDSSDYAAKPSKPEKTGKTKSTHKEEGTKIKSKTSNPVKSHARDKSKSKDSTKKKSSGTPNEKNAKSPKETQQQETKKSEVELPAAKEAPNNKSNNIEDEHKVSSSPHPPALSTNDQEPVPSISIPSSPKVLQSHSKLLDEKDQKNEIQEDTAVNQVVSASPKKISPHEQQSASPKKASPHERKKKSAKVNDTQLDVSRDANATDADRKEAATPVEIGVFGSKTIGSDIPETQVLRELHLLAQEQLVRPALALLLQEYVIAEKQAVGKVNVITDSESVKEQDEFENFVVEETPLIASLDQDTPTAPAIPTSGDQGQHGHLVAQILETQKELEDDSQFSFGDKDKHTKRVEIEWESGQRREKEIASKEVDRLRTSIQTLTRAANPLGKLMDFLQEDVDAMQRELELWKTTNEQLQVELLEEQSLTEESVEPMKIHLERLQQSISEKLDEISALKATILRNDIKIQKLVTAGFVQKSDVFA
ncbi:TRAF3-interacting protein 1 [Gryllus bimaculatus]|nr:TRAF3-interacting protein 1 [Gryllus bimaculatus]